MRVLGGTTDNIFWMWRQELQMASDMALRFYMTISNTLSILNPEEVMEAYVD